MSTPSNRRPQKLALCKKPGFESGHFAFFRREDEKIYIKGYSACRILFVEVRKAHQFLSGEDADLDFCE